MIVGGGAPMSISSARILTRWWLATVAIAVGPFATALTLGADQAGSQRAVAELEAWLQSPASERVNIQQKAFTDVALTREDAERAAKLLWMDHAVRIRAERADEMKTCELQLGDLKMKFDVKLFGEKPAGGRSLY